MNTKRIMQAIVFDCDGVIAESEDFHRQAYNRILAEEGFGIYWSKEQYGKDIAEMGITKIAKIGKERGIAEPEVLAKRLVLRKREVLHEIVNEALENKALIARSGVARLIREASDAGIKIGVASITNKSAVEAIIRGAIGDELFSRINFMATGDQVEKQKPAPDVYILAVTELRVDPARCVAIEDTNHGMQAAQSAGLKCVITPSELTRDKNFDGADLIVPDLGELGQSHMVTLDILDTLFSN